MAGNPDNNRTSQPLARSRSLRTPQATGIEAARLRASQRAAIAQDDQTPISRRTTNGTEQEGMRPPQSRTRPPQSTSRAQDIGNTSRKASQPVVSPTRTMSGANFLLKRSSSVTTRPTSNTARTSVSSTKPPPTAWKPAHTRSTSTLAQSQTPQSQRSSLSNSSTTKPAFSTYQQTFTPSHSRSLSRASSASTPSTPRKGSTASTPPSTYTSTTTTPVSIQHRLHLLHTSLLHSTATPTLKSHTSSAYTSLQARHTALQTAYTTILTLRRSARQSRNLLALHDWSGGNTASLIRKLSVLAGVLGELCALTTPDDNNDRAGGKAEKGRYTACVSGFEAWMAWVRDAWAMRDGARNTQEGGDAGGTAPVRIEGLGDGIKTEIRALGNALNALALKLEDLRAVPIPSSGAGSSEGAEACAGDVASSAKAGTTPRGRGEESGASDVWKAADLPSQDPTPALLLRYAWEMTQGMLEEVQMMREIEFEVVVGEKAWMEEELRRVGEEVEGGWG